MSFHLEKGDLMQFPFFYLRANLILIQTQHYLRNSELFPKVGHILIICTPWSCMVNLPSIKYWKQPVHLPKPIIRSRQIAGE